MSEIIRASDLMRKEFVSLHASQTLGDAMVALREAQTRQGLPNAAMIVDTAGEFVGMLTAKLLIRILVGSRDGDAAVEDAELLQVARGRLAERIGDALILDIPVVAPGDRLLTIIRRGVPTRLDFVPVVDNGRPVGFVPVTEIFQCVASIALTAEHEGIRFDR